MSRTIALSLGEFYHVYNRGTDKRDIFENPADYERFLIQMYLCNSLSPVRIDDLFKSQGLTLRKVLTAERGDPLVEIAAYCLMPNHFHFLIRECEEGGISRFMQKLLTGYTMYFNKRHERSGSLFQGTFKATHVDTERYFKYLISYIHLNPVKLIDSKWKEDGIRDRAGAERYLRTYPHSSFLDYVGPPRIEKAIIAPEVLLEYVDTPQDFASSVTEWLDYKKDDSEPI